MRNPPKLVPAQVDREDCSLTVDIGYALDLAMRNMLEKDRRLELAEARKGLALVPAKKARKKRVQPRE